MKFFRKKVTADADGYFPILSLTEIEEGGISAATVNGQKIVLTLYQGRLIAYDSKCPHAAADMSRGSVSGWKAVCPDHGYCFDLRSGRLSWPEDEPYRLKLFPTKIVSDTVFVKI